MNANRFSPPYKCEKQQYNSFSVRRKLQSSEQASAFQKQSFLMKLIVALKIKTFSLGHGATLSLLRLNRIRGEGEKGLRDMEQLFRMGRRIFSNFDGLKESNELLSSFRLMLQFSQFSTLDPYLL